MMPDQIEENAVLTVRKEIAKYDILKSGIPTGDKEISWDGHIVVFYDDKRNKKSWRDRINVQVKGHLVKKLKKGNSKFAIDVDDLLNYKKEGKGTLLLVVEMTDLENQKLYYANLLPVDLEEILRTIKDNQKEKSIDIKPVVEKTSSSLKNICLNFINNAQKQMKSKIIKAEEITKFQDVDRYEFDVVVPQNEKISDYILNNEIYTYGYKGDLSLAFPKSKITELSKNIEYNIFIEGIKYYNGYKYVRTLEKDLIKIGKSVVINITEKKISIDLKGNIDERINDINFFINLIKYKYLEIDNNKIKIPFNIKEENLKKQIKILRKDLTFLLKLKKSFKKFGVIFNANLEDLEENDWKSIDKLIALSENKQNIGINKEGVYYLKINKYKIGILAIKDINGRMNYYDYFKDISNVIKVTLANKSIKAENGIVTTPYIILKKEDFLTMSNINLKNIKYSISNIPEIGKQINDIRLLMLEILLAYDESKNNELLNLARYINNLIIKKDEKYETINVINKLQIVNRSRELKLKEIDELYNIRELENDNLPVLCAIAILLKNYSDFNRYFSKLSRKEKEEFKKYPIYNLLNKGK